MTTHPQTVPGAVRISGAVEGTSLYLVTHPGRTVMLAAVEGTALFGHPSVLLEAPWLRPLAAWFAGTVDPADTGEMGHAPDGSGFYITGDGAAVVWSLHQWVRLDASRPTGPALVVLRPRDGSHGLRTVHLTPEARRRVAGWLRRADTAWGTAP